MEVTIKREPDSPTEDTFPPFSEALIIYLERIYPNCCPLIHMSEREIFYKAGAVSVVQTLRAEYEKQKEERNK